MLAHDFAELVATLPDGRTTAALHITFERDDDEIGGAQAERRATAKEALGWLGARETSSGLDLHLTPASVNIGLSAFNALEAGGRRGQVRLRSVSCATATRGRSGPTNPRICAAANCSTAPRARPFGRWARDQRSGSGNERGRR